MHGKRWFVLGLAIPLFLGVGLHVSNRGAFVWFTDTAGVVIDTPGKATIRDATGRWCYFDAVAGAEKCISVPAIELAQSTATTGVTNAATAQGTANTALADAATGIANAATAQGTANTALADAATGIANAATAQGTANTAVANAATAQSTADAAMPGAGGAFTDNVTMTALKTFDAIDVGVAVPAAQSDATDALADAAAAQADATTALAGLTPTAILDADFACTAGHMRKTGAGTYVCDVAQMAAAVAPGVNDDVTGGYGVGSIWYDTSADDVYDCLDGTDGAAVWVGRGGRQRPRGSRRARGRRPHAVPPGERGPGPGRRPPMAGWVPNRTRLDCGRRRDHPSVHGRGREQLRVVRRGHRWTGLDLRGGDGHQPVEVAVPGTLRVQRPGNGWVGCQ